jgi:hypothetical protein
MPTTFERAAQMRTMVTTIEQAQRVAQEFCPRESRLVLACLRTWAAACVVFCLLAAAGAEEETPTNAGVMRLTRGWQWCEYGDARGEMNNSPSLEVLGRADRGNLDLDRQSFSGRASELQQHDRWIWKTFRAPSEWRGRPVWLTYDARRLAHAGVCELWLNRERLPIAVPDSSERGLIHPASKSESGEPQSSKAWFVNVGSRLDYERPNVVMVRLRRWPLPCSSGVWLYCPPEKERVLFLQSPGLSERARALVRRYADHVAKNFAVEPLIESEALPSATAIREYLKRYHREKRICGAVLIGDHPLPSYRFKAAEGYGGQPRYYEDLDAEFGDPDRDGFLDSVKAPVNFGGEIWTSYIRLVSKQKELFEPFLEKILSYYERRMCYPGQQLILPRDLKFGMKCGLDHYDLFTQAADWIHFAAHGGKLHPQGPHRSVSLGDALDFYPGAVVIELHGCHAGDIRREALTAAEAYLFGRSNALVVFTNARSEGPANPISHVGVREEMLAICPHLAAFYMYLVDLHGTATSSYLTTGYIMLGNPFINLRKNLAAPSGTILGRVQPSPNGGPVVGFYVSASQSGKWFGRVRTESDGSYVLRCLPPGKYEVTLHLNALEGISRQVEAQPNRQERVDWQLPSLWHVQGQVLSEDGKPNPDGWVDIASGPTRTDFREDSLFGLRTDDGGRFDVYGAKPAEFWLRGQCKGGVSEILKVSVRPGESCIGLKLQLEPPVGRGGKKPSVGETAQTSGRSPRGNRTAASTEPTEAELLRFEPQQRVVVESKLNLHPLADVTGLTFALVSSTNPTVERPRPAKGSNIKPDRGCASHALRIGVQVREPLAGPTNADANYQFQILGDETFDTSRKRKPQGDSYAIRASRNQKTSKWSCKLVAGERPDFTVPPQVKTSQRWFVVDLIPVANVNQLDLRVALDAIVSLGQRTTTSKKRVPADGWYHVQVDLRASPKLTVRYEQE